MIYNYLVDSIFSALRVVIILFPLFLIFESLSRHLAARISARVGPSIGISWIDLLKSLTKQKDPFRARYSLYFLFIFAVSMFSLVPWFTESFPSEFEIRLFLYISFCVLFFGAHFFLLYASGNGTLITFPSHEIFIFSQVIAVISLNESSLILLSHNGAVGVFHSLTGSLLILMQIFIGLVLFYLPPQTNTSFESSLPRGSSMILQFSKFVAAMSWICLHVSFLHPENRITLFGFAVGFLIFISLKTVMDGYAQFNEKLAGLLIWKYFFPVSLFFFVLILVGDWIE
jgi:hypothetical protein